MAVTIKVLSVYVRYGNSFLQAFGMAQYGADVVAIPDPAELWSPEGAGRLGQGFIIKCN